VSIKLSSIFDEFRLSGLITDLRGNDVVVEGFAPIESYGAGDLVFVSEKKWLNNITVNPPAAVVTTLQLADQLNGAGVSILVSSNLPLAHALLRQAFDDRDLSVTEWPRMHPSAVIHETARVPASAVIGPQVVIGSNVTLGEHVVVQAGAVIEQDVEIGAGSIIQARVYIGWGCRIGTDVRIKPGTVIGGEGFGLAADENKHYHRVPHRGIVVIEDDVIIGSNCNIDRATYGETRIGRGCRLDGLCHIAHNVVIDENSLIMAQTAIAGSSRIGKRVIASGQTGVIDHRTVADDVVLVHRCGVVEDIEEPGMYAGTPPQSFADYSRNIAALRKLHILRKKILALEKKLEELTADKT